VRSEYHLAVIRRRARNSSNSLDELATETSELVGRLLRENKALRAENLALQREVDRLSAGWEEIKRLARLAPRQKRRPRGSTRR
jgi:cell division protein FtsB